MVHAPVWIGEQARVFVGGDRPSRVRTRYDKEILALVPIDPGDCRIKRRGEPRGESHCVARLWDCVNRDVLDETHVIVDDSVVSVVGCLDREARNLEVRFHIDRHEAPDCS